MKANVAKSTGTKSLFFSSESLFKMLPIVISNSKRRVINVSPYFNEKKKTNGKKEKERSYTASPKEVLPSNVCSLKGNEINAFYRCLKTLFRTARLIPLDDFINTSS